MNRKHEEIIGNQSRGTKWRKAQAHSQDFIEWFEARIREVDASDLVKSLARGPNIVAKKFSGDVSNGYRFHTKRRDARRKTQNSGVTLDSLTPSFASWKDENPKSSTMPYYGVIKEIIELNYYSQFKFVVFNCDWYEFEEDNYGLTFVNFNKLKYENDPFVLASQVHQCFYMQDPTDKSKSYVMSKVSKDLLDENQTENGEGWNQSYDQTNTLPNLVNDEDI